MPKIENKMPISKYSCGNIKVAIWDNTKEQPNGDLIGFKTVSFSRSYKKKEEAIWRNEVVNLRKNDLAKAILVLQKAQEELLLDEKEGDEE